MNKEKDIQENYSRNLKAIYYHQEITEFFNTHSRILEEYLSFIHSVAKSGRFSGTKVLEIGSGATVHGVGSASLYYPNIVQSDYVEDNCAELRRWLKGESSLDWSIFLNVIASFRYTGGNLESSRKEIEFRIRKAVKKVVRCDVLSEEVLPLQELTSDDTQPPYDLVISCFILQAACPDFEAYIAALKRINMLIRPGGGLIVCDFVNGDETWNAGDGQFHYLKMSLEQVTEALKIAGFGKFEVKCFPKTNPSSHYNFDSAFSLSAEKL